MESIKQEIELLTKEKEKLQKEIDILKQINRELLQANETLNQGKVDRGKVDQGKITQKINKWGDGNIGWEKY